MSKKTSVKNIIITVLYYNINMIQYNMRVINITCNILYSVLVKKCSRQQLVFVWSELSNPHPVNYLLPAMSYFHVLAYMLVVNYVS